MDASLSTLVANGSVLVTGAAGFIGMHVAERLCRAGVSVLGVDNFNPYYDIRLKEARAARLSVYPNFRLFRMDLSEAAAVSELFREHSITLVIHLAAQAGVRYSLTHPDDYLRDNLVAFGALLEGCRHASVQHLVYASSSSVYGANHTLPFSEDQSVDFPISLYAATKKANELMAHSYSHLYRLPTTGLRFFTVYGPWGRPDMAPMLFADAIFSGRKIKVFNHGKMRRDFTYIDDVVEGVVRVAGCLPAEHPVSNAPYAVYNIGNHTAVELETFISTLASTIGKPAFLDYQPMQLGDVKETCADVSRLAALTGFAPSTPLGVGLRHFVAWFAEWRKQLSSLSNNE